MHLGQAGLPSRGNSTRQLPWHLYGKGGQFDRPLALFPEKEERAKQVFDALAQP
jgi:hypothetical protein